MRTFMRDAHFVSRQLQMTPEFILTVLLTLGISAKAAIFALMYTVLLRNSQLNEPAILVLQQFLTQSLLPWMEKSVVEWNEAVSPRNHPDGFLGLF